LLAAIQFIGFLVGGLVTFRILSGRPVCACCKKYLRVLARIIHRGLADVV